MNLAKKIAYFRLNVYFAVQYFGFFVSWVV